MEENARLRNQLNHNSEIIYISRCDSVITDSIIEHSGNRIISLSRHRVLNNSVNQQYNYLMIDKGSAQGLKKDMGVISGQGVVGVVTDVSENFATVISVLNRNFRVSASILRNSYFGIIEWTGRDPSSVRLREIPSHVNVVPGDTVVTSGYSAIFPPNLMIGIVDEVKPGEGNFYDISVNLSTNFRNLTTLT